VFLRELNEVFQATYRDSVAANISMEDRQYAAGKHSGVATAMNYMNVLIEEFRQRVEFENQEKE